jgi:GT2 family glycosyltransferase
MKFSVIIPTFNRPADLARCLAALACLDYPKHEFEVIVVDDGGSEDLDPVIGAHGSELQVRLYRQPNQGPAATRNFGASHAAGRFLAFIDDDCEPRSDWLKALDAVVQQAPDALIGGRVVNGLPEIPYSAASQEIADFLDQHFNRDKEHGRFFPSNNIAVPAELYREIGGFDVAFVRSASEDRDLCDRWLRRGWRLVSAPEAVAVHNRPMSLRTFCKQHFLYGRGAFSYAAARRRRNNGPVPFEGWRFHAGMILAPLRRSIAPASLYLSFLILVSQFAVVFGYFSEARRQKQQRLSSSYNLARK